MMTKDVKERAFRHMIELERRRIDYADGKYEDWDDTDWETHYWGALDMLQALGLEKEYNEWCMNPHVDHFGKNRK